MSSAWSGPAGVKVTSFKKPTPEEAAHHFLWRIRRALTPAGLIGVFNRSHYEDVIVGRVHGALDEAECQSVYAGVLQRTSTEAAPWYVIPGDRKWYRNWAIEQLLGQALKEEDLHYPVADFDIEAARARLQPPH